jgi:hypothetical protein
MAAFIHFGAEAALFLQFWVSIQIAVEFSIAFQMEVSMNAVATLGLAIFTALGIQKGLK